MLGNAIRRVLDVGVALVILVIGSPVLFAVAIAVRVRLGSPVLFRQRRLGRGGRPFDVLKFRTMRHPEPGREGSEFDAERLSRFGQFLRGASLDELPSMINLLRGDITLVGPRPLPEQYWTRYRGAEYERFRVKPGVTGLAQISGRNTVDWDERLAFDVEYVRTRGLRGDLAILLTTIPVVFGRSGVNHAAGVTMHALPQDRPHEQAIGTEPT